MRPRPTPGAVLDERRQPATDPVRDLIIDVGMHDGTDTAYYLAKGFQVVAVEANPALVAAAEERFAGDIDQGRLTIIGAAIAETSGTAPMAIADDITIWSSTDPAFIRRNQGVQYRYVNVPTVPFSDVLAQHGVPYFLKVDIEGSDMLPIRALRQAQGRPQFVSIESCVTAYKPEFEQVFDELAELWSLGYRSFKYVNQRTLARIRLPMDPLEGAYADTSFSGHSSGPFGRETPGKWLTARQALLWAEMLRVRHNFGGYGGRWTDTRVGCAYASVRNAITGNERPWYDLHARLGG